MTIALEGHFADRDTWSMQNCPVARTLAALGPPSAVLVLSEAYFGTNRFGDFVRNLAMTESAVTARLRHLVKAGLLSREPYQEPGQRTRYEYHLTKMGQDLAPTLVGLMEWGETYLPGDEGRQVMLTHADCGAAVTAQVRCTDGHDVGVDEIIMGPPKLDDDTGAATGGQSPNGGGSNDSGPNGEAPSGGGPSSEASNNDAPSSEASNGDGPARAGRAADA